MTVDRYLYVQYTLLILYDSQPRFRIYSIPLCQALEGSGGTSSAAATAVSAVHEGRNPGMVLVGPGGFMMTWAEWAEIDDHYVFSGLCFIGRAPIWREIFGVG